MVGDVLPQSIFDWALTALLSAFAAWVWRTEGAVKGLLEGAVRRDKDDARRDSKLDALDAKLDDVNANLQNLIGYCKAMVHGKEH